MAPWWLRASNDERPIDTSADEAAELAAYGADDDFLDSEISEPEISEPEISEPESSEPDAYEPAPYEPEAADTLDAPEPAQLAEEARAPRPAAAADDDDGEDDDEEGATEGAAAQDALAAPARKRRRRRRRRPGRAVEVAAAPDDAADGSELDSGAIAAPPAPEPLSAVTLPAARILPVERPAPERDVELELDRQSLLMPLPPLQPAPAAAPILPAPMPPPAAPAEPTLAELAAPLFRDSSRRIATPIAEPRERFSGMTPAPPAPPPTPAAAIAPPAQRAEDDQPRGDEQPIDDPGRADRADRGPRPGRRRRHERERTSRPAPPRPEPPTYFPAPIEPELPHLPEVGKTLVYTMHERPSSSNDERKIAMFVDFENIALGVRDSEVRTLDIGLILERLLEKGKIIVKKAYADWERYSEFKRPFHEAAIELIDIPQKFYSGKNSADIKMVVDSMDLCYSKEHLDTFVLVSGDSDFSPLVSKLKENNKYVIGLGVKNSSSALLIDNCDEFIYYEDVWRDAQRVPRLDHFSPKETECFQLLCESIVALLRENKDVLWGSLVKQTMQRKRPSFSEGYFGYATFTELLEDAERKGIIRLRRDQRSGTHIVVGFAPRPKR